MEVTARIAGKLHQEIQKRTKKSDAKFFSTTKRGEAHELKEDLNSGDKDREKNAVKKIIASMTLGRDVSNLFTDVVKLSRTRNMELKKLVYLYIMSNAKLQRDKAILTVNTFVLDTQHENAIVRALAIRTMLCIRVGNITDHCCTPLRSALSDKDAYVRKTAVIGVLKLFHTNPKLCEEQQFITGLQKAAADKVASVVANAVLALGEILDNSNISVPITMTLITRLLNALPECTEWGQVSLLDFIARYRAKQDDAEFIISRTLPRLQHSNPAVVLSAIRCIFKSISAVPEDRKRNFCPRITPPIISLMSREPEIQYILLRNLEVILRGYPNIFTAKEIKAFFCKFTDPTYVKIEKLKVILRLLSEKNADVVLKELEEYCGEVDSAFLSAAISALGAVAIRLDRMAKRVMSILTAMLMNNLAVQVDVLSTLKNILRKYPQFFEDCVPLVIETVDLESFENEDGKCSFIWMLGEFGGRPNTEEARSCFEYYIDNFSEQPYAVKLIILTASVKYFLRNSKENECLLNTVLTHCTENQDDPDLRDRAYMYWRMLSNDKHAAKMSNFVIGSKPPIRDGSESEMDLSRLNELLNSLNTVAAVYQRPAASFLPKYGLNSADEDLDGADDDEDDDGGEYDSASPVASNPSPVAESHVDAQPAPVPEAVPEVVQAVPEPKPSTGADLDFLFGGGQSAPAAAPKETGGFLDDIFGGGGGGTAAPAPAPVQSTDPMLLADADGLGIHGAYKRVGNTVVLSLHLTNSSQRVMSNFAVQFNSNILGLKNEEFMQGVTINPGATASCDMRVSSVAGHVDPSCFPSQIAIKNDANKPYYLVCEVPLTCAFRLDNVPDQSNFINTWKTLQEQQFFIDKPITNLDDSLKACGISFVGRHDADGATYFEGVTLNGVKILFETRIANSRTNFCVRSSNSAFIGQWLTDRIKHYFE